MRKKKYKLKLKNIIILLSSILLIFLFLLGKPCFNIIRLMFNEYSFDESFEVYKSGVYKKVLKREYNKTIANVVNKKEYVDDNFEKYYEIDYYNDENFLNNINTFLSLGYTSEEINLINSKQDSVLNGYLLKKYVSHISEWLDYDFFNSSLFERYLSYFDGDYKNTIVKVNIGLDYPFYENVNLIKDFSVSVLVNKYNKLDSSFTPSNLTSLNNCSSNGHYLSQEAKLAYDKLCAASLEEGMQLSVNSSYRSYEDQQEIYDSYFKLYGQSYVDKYVASPGFSEHQTGLALDIKSLNSSIFIDSKEYTWMINNAYKFGFILRYPENKKDITGYSSESWHFRYVGEEIANYIHENNITYDEYYVMFIE